ncbi:MAG TPA: tail fiber domain-containing protein, partial [Chitinophagaceae bacterium]|nr:tail fiber domain-containing protein [Chitinophagaceae bacterium]
LLIYQTDNNPGFYHYNGSAWLRISTANGELEKITENGKTGYRLLGKDTANYGSIGSNAIDLSHSLSASLIAGATGDQSTTLGTGTDAKSFSETTVGMYNTTYTPVSTTSHHPADRAFTVGVGTSDANRKNGLVVYKDGSLGLYPFTSSDMPYWMPNSLCAFNGVLYYDGLPVDNSPLAATSFAGFRKRLHKDDANYAPTGWYASDLSSMTGGNNDLGASGDFSFVANVNTKAKGYYSAALGQNTIAQTRSEFSVGAYNDTITSPNDYTWYGSDRIFQVGTGTSNATRSSSFVVYKNGRVLIAPANGVANNIPDGNKSYTGWQTNYSNWNINDQAALEVAPIEGSSNSTLKVFGRDDNCNITCVKPVATVGKKFMRFIAGMGVTEIGSITIGNAGIATNYNTTSDIRLKIDNGQFTRGLETINRLNIHNYTWKTGGKDVGVFAQELYKVYPNAVTKGDDEEVNNIEEIKDRW